MGAYVEMARILAVVGYGRMSEHKEVAIEGTFGPLRPFAVGERVWWGKDRGTEAWDGSQWVKVPDCPHQCMNGRIYSVYQMADGSYNNAVMRCPDHGDIPE